MVKEEGKRKMEKVRKGLFRRFLPVVACFAMFAADAAVELKTGPDRVKTPLKVDLKRIGTIRPRSTDEIKSSNWVIGCETLDRDYANFDEYKRFLKPLGIKACRFQGGWAKCEKEKGKYDFSWLDAQVDYALANGIEPALETSYGNPIYEGGGGPNLAGGFPYGEGRKAFERWVRAMARHFKGRVRDWLTWNEPENTPELYADPVSAPKLIAEMDVQTAKIILSEIPDARIGAICSNSIRTCPDMADQDVDNIFGRTLDWMGEDRNLFAWIVYHGYSNAPEEAYPRVENLKKVVEKRGIPASKLFQGENGCPSQATQCGALGKMRWTEYSQAKWDMRRMLGDLGHDVRSLVYSMSDLQYANYLGKGRTRHNAKGLVRTNMKNEVIAIKRAYYAVQNVVSVFDDTLSRVKEPQFYNDDPTLAAYEYTKADGRRVYAFWSFATSCSLDPRDKGVPMKLWHPFIVNYERPGESFETMPRVFRMLDAAPLKEPVWVDLMTGGVYEFPKENVVVNSEGVAYIDVPVYDSPCLLAEKSAIEIE